MATQLPYFLAQPVFGDPTQFTAVPYTGTAAQADAWLGVTPGTTRYAPCEGGGAIAITGVLTGPTSAAVRAAQAALSALAGAIGPLVVPTGLATFSGWDAWANCSFLSTALAWAPAGIVASPYGGYQVGYKVIFRRGDPIFSGFMSGPPLAPNWPSGNTPLGQPV